MSLNFVKTLFIYVPLQLSIVCPVFVGFLLFYQKEYRSEFGNIFQNLFFFQFIFNCNFNGIHTFRNYFQLYITPILIEIYFILFYFFTKIKHELRWSVSSGHIHDVS